MHGRKAGVSFGPKGAVVTGGEPGTTGRCLELLGGERNREVGRNNRPFPALVQSSLVPLSCCTWGLCGESVWVYMFKDPFSPDHTQKLEDEWLRYFKKNCKNPKMVSQLFGSLCPYSPTI